jgi:hypothetical protein
MTGLSQIRLAPTPGHDHASNYAARQVSSSAKGAQVGSKVKNPIPADTNGCSRFQRRRLGQ